MELGWIDFSPEDRDKVFDVLDLLSEQGALDELGISSVRDKFSDRLFPGTSTVQTRAKYFFIVPYILKDLNLSGESDYGKLKDVMLYNKEKECARQLLDKDATVKGIIGKINIGEGKDIYRTPSAIYWAGLCRYGIITTGEPLDECLNKIAEQNKKNESADFLNISDLYTKGWMNDISMNLTYEEGQFLKKQIISNCEDSLLAFILKEDLYEVLDCKNFEDLKSMKDKFPEKIRNDYCSALAFSEFIFPLKVIYNFAVSDGKNEYAKNYLSLYNLKDFTDIDISSIFSTLEIDDEELKIFLNKSRELMENEDIEGLKDLIDSREVHLKGSRAKSLHPGEFDSEKWFAGGLLDYRFWNAKKIIKDIYESEKLMEIEHVKS